jgi:citrate lyase gamma subunit
MKIGQIISAFLFAVLFSCGTSKFVPLQAEGPVRIIEPYSQRIYAGQEDGINQMVLILPVAAHAVSVDFDSVYYQGFGTTVEKSTLSGKTVYRADINISNTGIMRRTSPYQIEKDQALVSYNLKGQTAYFKVQSIAVKEAVYMP